MPSFKDPISWYYRNIYKKLTWKQFDIVSNEYLLPTLKRLFIHCKKSQNIFYLVIINIPNLTSSNSVFSKLLYKLTKTLNEFSSQGYMTFFNGTDKIFLIIPDNINSNIQNMVNKVYDNLKFVKPDQVSSLLKVGYTQCCKTCKNFMQLYKNAEHALQIANNSQTNHIVFYEKEKRHNIRIPCNTEVRYSIPGNTERITCSRNISAGGMKLSGAKDLPKNNNITIRFKLINTKNEILLHAKSIWTKMRTKSAKLDMGISFTYIDEEVKKIIQQYISAQKPHIVRL